MSWGLRTRGGIVTKAPTEEKAREWARYDFKGRLGDVGEQLVQIEDHTTSEWKEAA